MLKRNDLTKQFGDIVKAEIANHNEAICANNIAMDSIRKSIEALEERERKKVDKTVSRLDEELSSIKSFQELLAKEIESIKTLIIQVKADAVKRNNELLEITYHKLSQYSTHEALRSLDRKIECNMTKMKGEIESSSKRFEKEIYGKFVNLGKEKEFQDLRVSAIETGMESMTALFKDKVGVANIDAEGYVKEIRILKKYFYINEKKIENLYTLVDRLKEKKQE